MSKGNIFNSRRKREQSYFEKNKNNSAYYSKTKGSFYSENSQTKKAIYNN